MSTNPLHLSLLRPPILHILRAAGFNTTRPSVLDTLVDLASRYLTLLAAHTARHALLRHPSSSPPHDQYQHSPPPITITDVRLALQDAGALYPQLSAMEEQVRGEEDMRGIEAFISWCTGPNAQEIRRIAGMVPETSTAATTTTTNVDLSAKAAMRVVEGEEERPEDFLTQLKKKHAKTRDGEESRWAGTVLGREKGGEGAVRIEGWEGVEGLGEWTERVRGKGIDRVVEVGVGVGVGGSGCSSPLSEISAGTAT